MQSYHDCTTVNDWVPSVSTQIAASSGCAKWPSYQYNHPNYQYSNSIYIGLFVVGALRLSKCRLVTVRTYVDVTVLFHWKTRPPEPWPVIQTLSLPYPNNVEHLARKWQASILCKSLVWLDQELNFRSSAREAHALPIQPPFLLSLFPFYRGFPISMFWIAYVDFVCLSHIF